MIKINLITYNNQYGLTNDMRILAKLLEKHFVKKVDIKIVDFFHYKAPKADINIFLETVSKILFKYADINVLIPNQEWYYKNWIPYLEEIDYIFVKTEYAENLFKSLVHTRKDIVKMIGWKSLDRESQNCSMDFNHFLHLCGRSKHKQTQLMIDYWEQDFPKLTIVYSPRDVMIKQRSDLTNIEYITHRLSEEELTKLMNKCGIHLCCSETEGYGHYIHEGKSCGAVVITTNGQPMKNYVDDTMGFVVKSCDKKLLKKHLGSRYIIDMDDFKETIKKIQNTDIKLLKKMGQNARDSYLKESKYFDNMIKDVMTELFSHKKSEKDIEEEKEKMKEMATNDDLLPTVSIITPTYNRRIFFRLAVNNFMSIRYPKDKLEWIIVDDGTDKIKDMIENTPELKNDTRIKYFELDEKKPIGFKRNYCIEKASNEYIVCMDDDDYYPVNSVKLRILELLKSGKDCLTCSAIGCFDINRYVSMVNVPPHRLPFSHRISEASLAFKKSFWEVQKFNDESGHSEAKEFLEGRENKTIEVAWEGILVALLHNRNTSDKIMIDQSPNGCHYGWSDELFLFITSLDKELNEEELKNKKKKVKSQDPDDDGHLPNQ
jgi:glycosyltransferase involved in cell wall biosynthesis